MKNKNTKAFWNKKIASEYSALSQSPIYLDKNKIIANRIHNANGKLLNIGIGCGLLEKLIIDRKSKLSLFGIDISDEAIKRARILSQGNYVLANALEIPFESVFFDIVTILDVLEHFRVKELTRVLDEIGRVLKKHGILVVSVPLNESKKDSKLNRHYISFTKSSLIKLLEDNGFRIEEVRLLYAFKTAYFVKTIITRLFKLKQPNLIIVFCRKK